MKIKIYAAIAFIASLLFAIFEIGKGKSAEALLNNLKVKEDDLKLKEEINNNTQTLKVEENKVEELKKEQSAEVTASDKASVEEALKYWNKK